MTCQAVKLPGILGTAIVCTRGRSPGKRHRCVACHLSGSLQCDWKVGKSKTCDAYICPDHALEVAPNKHVCPAHREEYEAWKARQIEKERKCSSSI